MNRIVLGAFSTLLLITAGMFWWQGQAAVEPGKLPELSLAAPQDQPLSLPGVSGAGQHGPALPQVTEQTREQQRFNRLDRDRDNEITRVEMLYPRVAAFKRLDTDGNNLLSFEEWAVRTSKRFEGADANHNGRLDRAEYATTKPKTRPKKPECQCASDSDEAED